MTIGGSPVAQSAYIRIKQGLVKLSIFIGEVKDWLHIRLKLLLESIGSWGPPSETLGKAISWALSFIKSALQAIVARGLFDGWIPAFAGMTNSEALLNLPQRVVSKEEINKIVNWLYTAVNHIQRTILQEFGALVASSSATKVVEQPYATYISRAPSAFISGQVCFAAVTPRNDTVLQKNKRSYKI